MGNQTKQPRSFNTIRRSQTKERSQRRQWSRVVLLAMGVVILLILLSLVTLGIASIADVIIGALDKEPGTGDTNGAIKPSGTTTDVLYDQAIASERDAIHYGSLVLVNKQTQYQAFSSPKVSLVDIQEMQGFINGSRFYSCRDTVKQMEANAFAAFESMMRKHFEISEGDGSVEITAAYRSYGDQDSLSSSTPAGYSDHHTGMCIALRDGVTKQDMAKTHWVMQNCHKYGFIMRYPNEKAAETGVSNYENCLRYVGVAHATYITENGLCLEEYLTLLRTSYAGGEHLKIAGADGNAYEVYYVPVSGELTTYNVPSNYKYEVSGDNVSGFIVTVNLSAPV